MIRTGMYNELTNLLPLERQRALAREYVVRLSIVGVVLLTVLTLIAAALLFPTYVYLSKSMSAEEARLAAIESALSSTNEASLSARLTALTKDAALLTALAEMHGVGPSVDEVAAKLVELGFRDATGDSDG